MPVSPNALTRIVQESGVMERAFQIWTQLVTEAIPIQVKAVTSTSVSYTILPTDWLVIADTAAVTLTLPPAADQTQVFVIKNTSVGNITLDGDGSETIDGAATKVIATTSSLTVASDGSNWVII